MQPTYRASGVPLVPPASGSRGGVYQQYDVSSLSSASYQNGTYGTFSAYNNAVMYHSSPSVLGGGVYQQSITNQNMYTGFAHPGPPPSSLLGAAQNQNIIGGGVIKSDGGDVCTPSYPASSFLPSQGTVLNNRNVNLSASSPFKNAPYPPFAAADQTNSVQNETVQPPFTSRTFHMDANEINNTRNMQQNYYGVAGAVAPQGYTAGANMNDSQNNETQIKEVMQHNSSNYFIRCSVHKIPISASVKQKTHLPIAIVVQPLANLPVSEPAVPSVAFQESVIRCRKCRTYINPFVTWEANGRRWICNLCATVNETMPYYVHSLDQNGKREDRFERPELCMGSIEIIASAEYMLRAPQPPVFMFVIDVSFNAVTTGMVDAVCQGIKFAIERIKEKGNTRTLIGIITYDSVVHFYNLNCNLKQPQMLVVPDLNDLFLPIPNDILVNLNDSFDILKTMLDSLPNLWRNNATKENCMGSAVKAAHLAMCHIGGKMCLFTSSIPNCGEFNLKDIRDNNKDVKKKSKDIQNKDSLDKEILLLKPANDFYSNVLVTPLIQAQISVDLFVCGYGSNNFVDLGSISPLAKFTAGDTKYYPNFNEHLHAQKLIHEIIHAVTRETGWEAVMRIRVSRGWKITSWIGNFFLRGNDLLVLPNCNSDQTFTISVEMEENVVQDSFVYIQSALLYTNNDGERRIRVHNYCLPVTQNYADIIASMDAPCIAYIIAQYAIQLSLNSKLADGRNYIQTVFGQIMSASSSLLSSCESIKIFPLYIIGMLKSIAFRDSKDVTSDMRVYSWYRIKSLNVDIISAFFYPRMIEIHKMESECGTPDESRNTILPKPLNLSNERLTQEGAYILEDGESMLMWIGRAIDPKWLENVFGVQSLDHLHPDYAEAVIGTTGSSIGVRINSILSALRESRIPPYMKLTLLRQGDPLEHMFFSSLVEDRTHSMMLSLPEFLAKFTSRTALPPTAIRRTSMQPTY